MTFSVVAHDPATGELGVGVASRVLAVGRAVPWVRPGVGAVATQSQTRRGYGPHGLAGLAAGVPPGEVLATLVARDAGAARRQVAVVAADGRVAVHTGSECLDAAGHRTGPGWSVQGNVLAGPHVLDATAEAFLGAAGPLPERLLAALHAGETAGGDLRGRQSAALLVAGADRAVDPGDGVPVNLRVDDASDPLGELSRLLALQRAYELGDAEVLAQLSPEGPREVWTALDAARRGDVAGARRALTALRDRPGWDAWLRSDATARRLPHLTALLE